MPKSDILYDRAHIYSNPEELFNKEDRAKFKDGRVCDTQGLVHMEVGNNKLLEMIGVTIPTYARRELSSKKAIIDSARRIAGNLEDGLERCTGIANKRIIQKNFYFTPQGLHDYSIGKILEGKQVTGWVEYAKAFVPDIINNFPKNIRGWENMTIRLTPTLQALNDINTLGPRDGACNTIEGETFTERINNFLTMYDAVTAHINWMEQERRNIRNAQRGQRRSSSPDDVKVAELIFLNS